MSVILRHLDARLRDVADLMPPRLRILASQGVVAGTAADRLAVDWMVDLLDRKQRPTPTRMAAATSASPLILALTLRAGHLGTIGRRWLRRVFESAVARVRSVGGSWLNATLCGQPGNSAVWST